MTEPVVRRGDFIIIIVSVDVVGRKRDYSRLNHDSFFSFIPLARFRGQFQRGQKNFTNVHVVVFFYSLLGCTITNSLVILLSGDGVP